MAAGSRWHDGDFAWCQANGRPIGAHADWDGWKALLKAAKVRDARLHDARHTAATLLLAQGVDQRVVMEILGYSQISMTTRYTHVLPQIMIDAADRIGQALWGSSSGQLQLGLQPARGSAVVPGESDQFKQWGAWGSNPEPTD
jgi:integrase